MHVHADLTELPEDDDILWNSLIAKIFSTFDGPDGRFRDRLKLNKQTGSLTITNITTQHAGHDQLQISGAKLTSKSFRVSVYGERSFIQMFAYSCFIKGIFEVQSLR